jgi:hypothetical protein
MAGRPLFIEELLGRPLPLLTPPRLSDKSNPPYSVDIQNQIADLQCHPLLESAVSPWNRVGLIYSYTSSTTICSRHTSCCVRCRKMNGENGFMLFFTKQVSSLFVSLAD